MKIIINDVDNEEIEIVVNGKLSDVRVLKIIELLRNADINTPDNIILKKDDIRIIKELGEIEYFSASSNEVFAHFDNKSYSVKFKLYELESFSEKGFIRISKSCIVNVKYIKHIEPEFSGNYLIVTKQGEKLVVSRSYFKSFKEYIEGGKYNENSSK